MKQTNDFTETKAVIALQEMSLEEIDQFYIF